MAWQKNYQCQILLNATQHRKAQIFKCKNCQCHNIIKTNLLPMPTIYSMLIRGSSRKELVPNMNLSQKSTNIKWILHKNKGTRPAPNSTLSSILHPFLQGCITGESHIQMSSLLIDFYENNLCKMKKLQQFFSAIELTL